MVAKKKRKAVKASKSSAPAAAEAPPRSPRAAGMDQGTRSRLRELLARARRGESPEVDQEVRAAGYGDPPGERITITSRQLEQGLELSRRQIQEYITDGMPRLSDAHGNKPAIFDLWPAMRWLRDFFRRAGGLPAEEAAKYERQKREYELRRQRADAELKERQAWVESGHLVERDKVEADMRHLLLRLQVGLENLPALLSAEAVGKGAEDIAECTRAAIAAAWNGMLDDLRRALPPKLQPPVAPLEATPPEPAEDLVAAGIDEEE